MPAKWNMPATVYTKTPGASLRIGTFGEASNTEGVRVPDEVADELAKRKDLRIVRDEPPAPKTPAQPAKRADDSAKEK